MHKRRQGMDCRLGPRVVVPRSTALAERRAAHRSGVPGAAARPSAGCAGSGGGSEHWRPEGTA